MKLNQKNFINNLNKHITFENKPIVTVAVSGGPDSMALLFLMKEWIKKVDGKLIALIVNHNIRKESLIEANAICNFLTINKIKCKILTVKKKKVQKKNMSESRSNRYDLLLNYCKKNNLIYLFIAHHQDDNIETYINRRVAGSDFEGLGSMDFISKKNNFILVRPLLNFSKNDILNYNTTKNIPFIQDPTNLNLNYTRSIIRHSIKNLNKKTFDEIKSDFKNIKSNMALYKIMISQILLKNIISVNKNYIEINLVKFKKFDDLILEKLIKKIYIFFYNELRFLRSSKTQNLINQIKSKKFKVFNLKGMLIKKVDNSLFFSKISN